MFFTNVLWNKLKQIVCQTWLNSSCLVGGQLLWIWPQYWHVNQKSNDDDDDDDDVGTWGEGLLATGPKLEPFYCSFVGAKTQFFFLQKNEKII